MGRFFTLGTALVIPNGGTTSNVVTLPDDCDTFTVYGPAALTNAVTVQVSPDGTNFFGASPLGGGTAITVAITVGVGVKNAGYRAVRLLSAGAEAAARTFQLTFQNQN